LTIQAASRAPAGEVDVATRPPAWRVTLFRVLAGLAGCVFILGTLPQAISPWGPVTLSNMQGVHDANLHRWSAALAGGPDLGMAAVLLYLAWRPMRAPLVLQWLALAATVFLAANVPFVGPSVVVVAIPVVLLLAAYPDPRSLVKAAWVDGVRFGALVLGLIVAIFLLTDATRAMAAQIGGTGELARNYDAASNAEHLANISLAALLAGMKRRGSQVLTLMVAAVLAFMGAAAITVPTNPGSWGLLGGAVAVAGGLALAAVSAYVWQRSNPQLEGSQK
jgi:hypothetical protein